MESTPPEIDITNEVPAGLPGLHLSFRKLQTWLSTDGGDASPRIGSASTAANCSKKDVCSLRKCSAQTFQIFLRFLGSLLSLKDCAHELSDAVSSYEALGMKIAVIYTMITITIILSYSRHAACLIDPSLSIESQTWKQVISCAISAL